MDVVAGVASISQVAVYTRYAAEYLLRLYSTARHALSLVKCQQDDILILLQVIHRLNSDNSSLDSDLLLPVLIRVIDIARTLHNWFDESGVLGIKWTLVKRRSQIDDALKTLKQKSDILRLYLVERNHAILLRLETSLTKETRNIAGSIETISLNVMNSAQASASQSSTSPSLVGRKHMDEGTRQIVTSAESQLQPQHLQPQYQQHPSTTQSNNQTPQDRPRMTSKLKICGNELEASRMSLANGMHDPSRDLDIECSNNKGKKATWIAFNRNEGDEQREGQSEGSQQSSRR